MLNISAETAVANAADLSPGSPSPFDSRWAVVEVEQSGHRTTSKKHCYFWPPASASASGVFCIPEE